MEKLIFVNEVQKRLSAMFTASKAGYRIASVDKHRLEGFMQAGVFLKVVSNKELAELMEETHLSIFGKTIMQRRSEKSSSWHDDEIRYDQYEQPAYERKRHK